MGASDWHYVVDYREDAAAAFAELQRTVMAAGDFYRGLGDRHAFTSMADLEAARNTETFWDEGTHSILDMVTVVAPDAQDETAAVRVLRDDEVRAQFGTDRPTTADFERFLATEWYVNRWEGRATVLYRDGQPTGLAFWGISGD